VLCYLARFHVRSLNPLLEQETKGSSIKSSGDL
jgi:hypothetical protein